MKRTKAELEDDLAELRCRLEEQRGLLETSTRGEERLASEVDTLGYTIKRLKQELKDDREHADHCRRMLWMFARLERIEPSSLPDEDDGKDDELEFKDRVEILLELVTNQLGNIPDPK